MLDEYKDIRDGDNINKNIVKKYLEDHSYKIPEKLENVSSDVRGNLEFIIGKENPLTKLLLILTYFKFIDPGDIIKEKECKVYNIDREELLTKIDDNTSAEELYKAKINDIYYDFEDLSLKNGKYTKENQDDIIGLKSSIRTRAKEIIDFVFDEKIIPGDGSIKNFCTIKKEDPDNESEIVKDVYEMEFPLLSPTIYIDLIRLIGLQNYKGKNKNRRAFKLGSMGFDLDEYFINENNVNKIDNTLPDLRKIDVLEIETKKESHLKGVFRSLGIKNNEKFPKSKDGFGEMFKKHGYKVKKLIKKLSNKD